MDVHVKKQNRRNPNELISLSTLQLLSAAKSQKADLLQAVVMGFREKREERRERTEKKFSSVMGFRENRDVL